MPLSGLLPGAGNRPTIDVNDAVEAPNGATRIEIGIADLLGNDTDLDGDPFMLGAFQWSSTVASNVSIIDAGVVAAAGFDPARYPRGLVLVDLAQPLTATLTFNYLSLDSAANLFGTGATITVSPVQPSGPLAADDALRGTIGGSEVIFGSDLLANDAAGVTLTGLAGMQLLNGTT